MDCFHVYSSEITYGRDEDEDDDTFQATGSFSVGVPAGGAVSFALDGIEILNVQFSDFSDEGADVYDYRSADGMTRIVLNWNDCSWAVSGHGLGLSGVDNSDGVLHQLAFGSLTGEETVSMVATGHGLSYLALDPVNCCDEDEESDETGEAVFMRTRGVGNLILRAR
jgi:hypothetical protein